MKSDAGNAKYESEFSSFQIWLIIEEVNNIDERKLEPIRVFPTFDDKSQLDFILHGVSDNEPVES